MSLVSRLFPESLSEVMSYFEAAYGFGYTIGKIMNVIFSFQKTDVK